MEYSQKDARSRILRVPKHPAALSCLATRDAVYIDQARLVAQEYVGPADTQRIADHAVEDQVGAATAIDRVGRLSVSVEPSIVNGMATARD